jgi:magnesium-transporting ATPase (P-type)
MLMFSRRQKPLATIIIDGSSLLLGDALQIDHFWPAGESSMEQLQQAAAQAVNTPAEAIDRALAGKKQTHQPLREFAFTHQYGASGTLWHAGANYTLFVKGLPERVLTYCDVTENERESAALQIQKLSAHGTTILAVASATQAQPITTLGELHKHQQLTFNGLVSLTNTVPGDIRELVRQARARGVSLRLLTGTHQQTAFAIAKQLGIAAHSSDVCDARQLHVAPAITQSATVFARALPEHKARVIKELQAMNDNVVVVTTKEELRTALTTSASRRKG